MTWLSLEHCYYYKEIATVLLLVVLRKDGKKKRLNEATLLRGRGYLMMSCYTLLRDCFISLRFIRNDVTAGQSVKKMFGKHF